MINRQRPEKNGFTHLIMNCIISLPGIVRTFFCHIACPFIAFMLVEGTALDPRDVELPQAWPGNFNRRSNRVAAREHLT